MSEWRSRLEPRALWLAAALVAVLFTGALPAVLNWAIAAAAAWLCLHGLTGRAAGRGTAERDAAARSVVTAMVVAVAAASLWYRSTQSLGLQQTGALFVGVPAVLAVVVVQLARPRSAGGVALKTVSIGLLVSLMLLDEGVLCVLLSAPLFFFIAFLCAKIFEEQRRPPQGGGRRLVSALVGLSIVPMTLEGVTPQTTVARDEVVVVTRTVAAPFAAVRQALLAPPRFERPRPRPLRLGFPWPEAARVDDGTGGPIWTVTMRGGETRLTGMEPKTGTLRLQLVDAGAGYARWQAVSDDSHMRHFLTWVGSDVRYAAVDAVHTSVSWTVRYRRDLDPAWYFAPMERLAVRLAAGYLIDTVATP